MKTTSIMMEMEYGLSVVLLNNLWLICSILVRLGKYFVDSVYWICSFELVTLLVDVQSGRFVMEA